MIQKDHNYNMFCHSSVCFFGNLHGVTELDFAQKKASKRNTGTRTAESIHKKKQPAPSKGVPSLNPKKMVVIDTRRLPQAFFFHPNLGVLEEVSISEKCLTFRFHLVPGHLEEAILDCTPTSAGTVWLGEQSRPSRVDDSTGSYRESRRTRWLPFGVVNSLLGGFCDSKANVQFKTKK